MMYMIGKLRNLKLLWFSVILLVLAGSFHCFAQNDPGIFQEKKALIIYDNDPIDLGSLFSAILRNLLGHFDLEATVLPMNRYRQGLIDKHHTIF